MDERSTGARRLPILLAAALLAASPAHALSVEEAYRQTGHRHASLDPTSAGFRRDQAAFLSRLFELLDLAIVEKTQVWIWFQSEGQRGEPVREYAARVDFILAALERLEAPESLRSVRTLLLGALRDQRAFFETWDASRVVGASGEDDGEARRSLGRHLRTSSQKLHQAYGLLMDLFPDAGQQNFDAFYDHVCVLDLL